MPEAEPVNSAGFALEFFSYREKLSACVADSNPVAFVFRIFLIYT